MKRFVIGSQFGKITFREMHMIESWQELQELQILTAEARNPEVEELLNKCLHKSMRKLKVLQVKAPFEKLKEQHPSLREVRILDTIKSFQTVKDIAQNKHEGFTLVGKITKQIEEEYSPKLMV